MNIKGVKGEVLLVDQYNKIGGGQSVLIDLINSFGKLGFKCVVAIPEGGFIESNVKESEFYYLPPLVLNNKKKSILDSLKLFIHYFRVLGLIKKVNQADMVYVNGPRYFILFYVFSFFIKKKFIYHVHLDFSNSGKFILKLLNKQQNTRALAFTSNYLLTSFLEYYKDGHTSDKLYVIEPCIAQKFEDLAFKNRFDKIITGFNFISVGRVYPEKGFDLIVQLAQLFKEHNFYIVGDAVEDSVDYYNSLKLSAPGNVHFTGSSNNIPALVDEKNIHFGIVPSAVNEAFGIVAIELMMCSCIALLRQRGGLIELSAKTGAIAFDDIESLKKVVYNINTDFIGEKKELAYKQYTNTKMLYNANIFTEKLNKLISI